MLYSDRKIGAAEFAGKTPTANTTDTINGDEDKNAGSDLYGRLDPASFAHQLAANLPRGVLGSPQAFCDLDYTLTDPMNMKGADHIIFAAI